MFIIYKKSKKVKLFDEPEKIPKNKIKSKSKKSRKKKHKRKNLDQYNLTSSERELN